MYLRMQFTCIKIKKKVDVNVLLKGQETGFIYNHSKDFKNG
jgi:hypothetical protein